MTMKKFRLFAAYLPLLICIMAVHPMGAGAEAPDDKGVDAALYFSPLPKAADNPANPLNDEKVELGKMLFFDPRLSRSGFISCNSCHSLASAGVDNLPVSIGHKWRAGARNAPTVLNAAILGSMFWDGRAKDLEEQAKGPILNPIEMAATERLVVARLSSIPEYVERFNRAFASEEKRETLTYDNAARAIAAFERTLLTRSRFDDYLEGRKESLSRDEEAGLQTFISKGCVGCHNGPAGRGRFVPEVRLRD